MENNASNFLRSARAGNIEKVLEFLKGSDSNPPVDIDISNTNGLNALHLASKEGHSDLVEELLKLGANVNAATKKGNTALHIASLAGQFDIVKTLIDYGADVNAQSQNGFTPLYMAAQENHDNVVRYLVDHGAKQSITTEDGFTPLAVALQQGHKKVVAILLENENLMRQNEGLPKQLPITGSQNGVMKYPTNATNLLNDKPSSQQISTKLPALHVAAKKNDCKVAEMLLQQDRTNANVTSKSGFTPLHIACHYGNKEIGQLLIEYGADVNFHARHDITPLHVASRWGKVNMVELLLQNNADIEARTRDGLTPLHCAARSGHEDVVRFLVRWNPNYSPEKKGLKKSSGKIDRDAWLKSLVMAKTKNGLTPLHMASQGDHVTCAETLITEGGSLVDEITVDYLTSLHICSHYGNLNTAKLLIQHGADVNARAMNGFTPLHIACKKNRTKIVELLLNNKASIMCTTESGLTPLHVAAFMGHMNVVAYLINFGKPENGKEIMDINACTIRGETPLHLAARANQTDIMRLLLRNGAQVDARAKENQTPLHIASRLGNTDTALLLLQHKASPLSLTTDHYTPLHLAVKEGHPETLACLLDFVDDGSVLNDQICFSKKGFAPLHLAAKCPMDHQNSTDKAVLVSKLLLDKGAFVDIKGKNDVTPLHVAVHYDRPALVNLLLERGANPLAHANNGYTPLHIAAKKNNEIKIARMLVSALNPEMRTQGVNSKSRSGFTPLHLAAQSGNVEMINFLLQCGADPFAASNNGLTPLHLAAQNDRLDCIKLLIDFVSQSYEDPVEKRSKLHALVNKATVAGYTPLHTACHFGRLNTVRYLLDCGADTTLKTVNSGYTPLHQAAQQGHSAVVNLLLQHNASPNTLTNQGQTALSIAQKLGYVSLIETLKVVTETIMTTTTTTTTIEEKYKVNAPETMQEAANLSDSDDEDEQDVEKSFKAEYLPAYLCHYEGALKDISVDDTLLGDQSYRYLTTEQMKSLGDDSIRLDEPSGRLSLMETSQGLRSEFSPDLFEHYQEEVISPTQLIKREEARVRESMIDPSTLTIDNIELVQKPPIKMGFLVSFMVDARGGSMRGCRHSGVRVIIPPRKACGPLRVTCKFIPREKLSHQPPLMEGEGLACRILELGPVGTKFLGPVIIEIPHFASLRNNEREIIILRSDDGEVWREHVLEASESAVQEVLNQSYNGDESDDNLLHTNRITRILTADFPMYFAIISRMRQELHTIGPEGGIITSTNTTPTVRALFPEGALTKRIRIGLQSQSVSPELVANIVGSNRVAVSPIVTIEPRRRKFHKPITLTIPIPEALNKGMINSYGSTYNSMNGELTGNNPNTEDRNDNAASTLRLLCSITGGTTPALWEDITGSTPLTFVNDYVSFTTTVSARFWLMDCRNISEAAKYATDVYHEVNKVPYMGKMVVYAKRSVDNPLEANVRTFILTDDDRPGQRSLEKREGYTEIAHSKDIEVIENKPLFMELFGNLVTITKSIGPPTNTGLPTHYSNDSEKVPPNFAITFMPFHLNRIPFKVRIKDGNQEAMGRLVFLSEAYGPLTPICTLNIVLPKEDYTFENDLESGDININVMDSLSKDLGIVREVVFKEDQLLDYLAKELQDDWEKLANNFNFTNEEIKTIQYEYPKNPTNQAKAFFIAWKHKHGDRADDFKIWDDMESALTKINKQHVLKHYPLMKSSKTSSSHIGDNETFTSHTDSKEFSSQSISYKNEPAYHDYTLDDQAIYSDERSKGQSPDVVATHVEKVVPKRPPLPSSQKIDQLKSFVDQTGDNTAAYGLERTEKTIRPINNTLPLAFETKHPMATKGNNDINTINGVVPSSGKQSKNKNLINSARKSLQNLFGGAANPYVVAKEGGNINNTHNVAYKEGRLIERANFERERMDDEASAAQVAGKYISKDIIKEAQHEIANKINPPLREPYAVPTVPVDSFSKFVDNHEQGQSSPTKNKPLFNKTRQSLSKMFHKISSSGESADELVHDNTTSLKQNASDLLPRKNDSPPTLPDRVDAAIVQPINRLVDKYISPHDTGHKPENFIDMAAHKMEKVKNKIGLGDESKEYIYENSRKGINPITKVVEKTRSSIGEIGHKIKVATDNVINVKDENKMSDAVNAKTSKNVNTVLTGFPILENFSERCKEMTDKIIKPTTDKSIEGDFIDRAANKVENFTNKVSDKLLPKHNEALNVQSSTAPEQLTSKIDSHINDSGDIIKDPIIKTRNSLNELKDSFARIKGNVISMPQGSVHEGNVKNILSESLDAVKKGEKALEHGIKNLINPPTTGNTIDNTKPKIEGEIFDTSISSENMTVKPKHGNDFLKRARQSISKTFKELNEVDGKQELFRENELDASCVSPSHTSVATQPHVVNSDRIKQSFDIYKNNAGNTATLTSMDDAPIVPKSAPTFQASNPKYSTLSNDSTYTGPLVNEELIQPVKIPSKIPKPPGLIHLSDDEKIKMFGQVLRDTDDTSANLQKIRLNNIQDSTKDKVGEKVERTDNQGKKQIPTQEIIIPSKATDVTTPRTIIGESENETILNRIKVVKKTREHTFIKDGQEEKKLVEETFYDDGTGNLLKFEDLDPIVQDKLRDVMNSSPSDGGSDK